MNVTAAGHAPSRDLTQLRALEAEAIHIIREVIAEFDRPCLLFSGGKDSVVMLHLAVKAVQPAGLPFPVVHIDTGHNFPEAIEFRDRTVDRLGLDLVVGSVEDAIASGRIPPSQDPGGSRNRLQTPVLLETIRANKFGAVFGGARRDEERSRAKERVYSFRDEFGQWDPKNQRPEVWNLY
ncbi:MAG: sulfate adenylyltransferase subunit CysD, partial [Dehalococcoidia bacterium]